jgi:hypothetical protein
MGRKKLERASAEQINSVISSMLVPALFWNISSSIEIGVNERRVIFTKSILALAKINWRWRTIIRLHC